MIQSRTTQGIFKRMRLAGALLAALAAATMLSAQGSTGTVRGRVLDSANGEPMIGVTAVIKELGVYGVTDIDGNYVINNVPAGEHTVTYQITGYQPSATKVTVGGKKPVVANITLNYKVSSEVVVTAKRVDNTTASLLAKQKKAAVAQDAISAEQMRKSPDNSAADSAKRITGISIVGNGNIFVRGMPERYSMIQVNGTMIPSPIPTRRIIPLDIFPVSLLDNMTIIKSYLPSLQGEFGGGVVDINAKDFPEEKEASVGLQFGINSITTFKTFGTYTGGNTDFLGYDDGTRNIPKSFENSKLFPYDNVTKTGYSNSQLNAFAQQLPNVWSRSNTTALPMGKLTASYGNTYQLDEQRKLGFSVGGFFQESSQTEKGTFKRYLTDGTYATNYTYEDFSTTALNSAQFTGAYADSRHSKLRINSFYTHKGIKTTRQNTGQLDFSTPGIRTVLNMTESSLLFNQMSGEHRVDFLESEISWFGSYSRAGSDTPDRRTTTYSPDGKFIQANNFIRYFNKHDENIYQGGLNWAIPFSQWSGLKSKFTLGINSSYRDRQTVSRRFYNDLSNTAIDLHQSAEQIFSQGTPLLKELTGTSAAEGFDSYNGTLFIRAGYSQLDIPIIPRVRLIGGARVESWEQETSSFNYFDRSQTVNSRIAATNILPSANLVFSPLDDLNVRFGASQTINRPDFIEASNFRLFDDLLTGAIIKGNPDLKIATINNYDTRIEWFPSAGEIIAVSGFYKDIQNPIEAVISALADDLQFSYVNQTRAKLVGGEFEIRKNLAFISSYIRDFSVLFNATYVYSQITANPGLPTAETNPNRPLQGQSPWLLNTGLYYERAKSGTTIVLLYNIFAPRISQVGVNGLPNWYQESFGTLDATARQTLGEKLDLKVSAQNILNPEIRVNQGQGSDAREIQTYRRGVNFSIGLTYSL